MKIIIINGPCGIGKSTIAVRLHEAIPLSSEKLTYLLNIDEQRRLFSHYRAKREESKEASLRISETIISTCLKMKHDVIIDKMLFDTQVIDSYYEIAKQNGAEVKEIILWATKEALMKRANERGWRKPSLLTPEKCEFFWHQIDEVKDKRPNAVIIDTSNSSEDETLMKIQKECG